MAPTPFPNSLPNPLKFVRGDPLGRPYLLLWAAGPGGSGLGAYEELITFFPLQASNHQQGQEWPCLFVATMTLWEAPGGDNFSAEALCRSLDKPLSYQLSSKNCRYVLDILSGPVGGIISSSSSASNYLIYALNFLTWSASARSEG